MMPTISNVQLTPNHAQVTAIGLTARYYHLCLHKDEEDISDTKTDHVTKRALSVEVLQLSEDKVDEHSEKKEQ